MSSNPINIPKRMGHIWVGPLQPPTKWMSTWREKHPDWEYTLYGNSFLREFDFRTHKQIAEYYKRGMYAGVADLMRLEILYEFGGLIPEADSICLLNTDSLYQTSDHFTVYENEFVRGKLVSPIQACIAKSPFINAMIEHLCQIDSADLDEPWISTGNLFTALMIQKIKPSITIFPSHYFIPIHYTGLTYEGTDAVYAKQLFGSTQNSYEDKMGLIEALKYQYTKRLAKIYRKQRMQKHNQSKVI